MGLNPQRIGNRLERCSHYSIRWFAHCALLLGIGPLFISSVDASGSLIQSVDPLEGYVGQTIKIMGDKLKTSRRVHFLVGRTVRAAKFTTVSNNQLDVVVPECYRANADACILIESDEGIAFTCPTNETVVQENQPNFNPGGGDKTQLLHIVHGGVVQRSDRPTVVESGGILGTISDHCPLLIMKSGSLLAEIESHNSTRVTIFHEPGARFGDKIANLRRGRVQVISVKSITLAEGVGPFLFVPDPNAPVPAVAAAPAEIKSFSPHTIVSGDLLTVRGKGFSDTKEVLLTANAPVPVDFSVVSDTELRVEMPERFVGHHELMIINSKGLTITHTPAPLSPGPVPRGIKFHYVGDGVVLNGSDLGKDATTGILVVEKGGTLMNRHVPFLSLIKSGGTLAESIGPTYAEAGASVLAAVAGRNRLTKVDNIQIVKLNSPLNIVSIPLGR